MTEPDPSDKSFNDYLDGKSELSKIYSRTSAAEPHPTTDAKILDSARNASAINQADRKSPQSARSRWTIPLSLAAAVVMAVLIFQIVPERPIEPTSLTHTETRAAATAAPERLLQDISTQIHKGELEQARQAYTLFKQLFPDYVIDYSRYPELRDWQD